MKPKLPMIDSVTHTFLRQAAAQLQSGAWLERVAAGYAKALVDGYHRALLSRTKFENFIWRLQRCLDKHRTDELLAHIYGCTGKQYNLNHSALAFLLKRRVCLACLTTNFDNALELCLPSLRVFNYPDRPAYLPSEHEAPILAKLHGDALTKTCVATSPELSQAKLHNSYSFLEDLLRDRVVLVLGYSGTGDVDISHHLGKYERHLLWGKYSDQPGARRHKQIDFVCDLSATEPGKEKNGKYNLLLELATSYGWKDNEYGDDSHRQAIVRGTQATEVVDLLRELQNESNYYLDHIAIREIQHWLGKPVSAGEIRKFFDECVAMEEWEGASFELRRAF